MSWLRSQSSFRIYPVPPHLATIRAKIPLCGRPFYAGPAGGAIVLGQTINHA
jgi:hypothetical protein